MIRVIIAAPKGMMDSMIVQEAYKHPDFEIIGTYAHSGSSYLGDDCGLVSGIGRKIGVPVSETLDEIIGKCDIVIDFSRKEASMKALECCVSHGKAFLCGTTGFDEAELSKFSEAGKRIVCMRASNTSYVVNVMRKLLGMASKMLGEKAGIDIIDLHSASKLDAPSGTAIELGEEIAGKSPCYSYEDISFHSVRSGNTPSSHEVVFGCRGEMLKISHDAFDYRCFAAGALDAALFLYEKLKEGKPGLYTMDDVLDAKLG